MRKAIYTAIIGSYDSLKFPLVYTPGWDYICFTNNLDLKSDFWKIIYLQNDKFSSVKLARKIKILVHLYLPNYNLTIWHDASMQINCNLNSFIQVFLSKEMAIMKHPNRSCIYDEAKTCIALAKDKRKNIMKQVNFYRSTGYPAKAGLVASGIIIRKNSLKINKLMKAWWDQVEQWSHRDQLSFNFVYYKHLDIRIRYMPFSLTRSKFLLSKHCR